MSIDFRGQKEGEGSNGPWWIDEERQDLGSFSCVPASLSSSFDLVYER